MPTPAPVAEDSGGSDANVDASVRVQLASFAQSRIIVHTARMTMVVENIADAVDRIGGVAESLNGWVVSSDRSSSSTGAIAIRVPAASLDEAFRQLESLAIDVEARAVTSQDFTDEYVDTQSRLVSLRATEQRLLSFLERSANVEEALLVEAQLSSLLQEIEAAQGRLNYLGETSAYSLIEVSLKIRAVTILVDAGPDSSVRVGELARFRASFTAPQGIDEFAFVWNFGDGTSTGGSGSAPTPAGNRVTATVTHVYGDDRDSPYIVTVDLTGAGDRGLVEGSDSLLVSVSRVPVIEVFAGEDRTVEEGDDVDYTASFTRPVELRDYEYRWDFAGSPTRTGKLEEGRHPRRAHSRFPRSPARSVRGRPNGERHERRRPGVGLRFVLRAGYGIGRVRDRRMEHRGDDQGSRARSDGGGAGRDRRGYLAGRLPAGVRGRRGRRLPREPRHEPHRSPRAPSQPPAHGLRQFPARPGFHERAGGAV